MCASALAPTCALQQQQQQTPHRTERLPKICKRPPVGLLRLFLVWIESGGSPRPVLAGKPWRPRRPPEPLTTCSAAGWCNSSAACYQRSQTPLGSSRYQRPCMYEPDTSLRCFHVPLAQHHDGPKSWWDTLVRVARSGNPQSTQFKTLRYKCLQHPGWP